MKKRSITHYVEPDMETRFLRGSRKTKCNLPFEANMNCSIEWKEVTCEKCKKLKV
jgi:hypothetical protein